MFIDHGPLDFINLSSVATEKITFFPSKIKSKLYLVVEGFLEPVVARETASSLALEVARLTLSSLPVKGEANIYSESDLSESLRASAIVSKSVGGCCCIAVAFTVVVLLFICAFSFGTFSVDTLTADFCGGETSCGVLRGSFFTAAVTD